MKLIPMQPEKMNGILSQVRNTHKASLKSQFTNAFRDDIHFSPASTKSEFQYSYQNFNSGIGFDAFHKKKEFSNIFYQASEQIKKDSSLRRWLNLEYSDSEISDQVDAIIK
jgi:hypothetical protein